MTVQDAVWTDYQQTLTWEMHSLHSLPCIDTSAGLVGPEVADALQSQTLQQEAWQQDANYQKHSCSSPAESAAHQPAADPGADGPQAGFSAQDGAAAAGQAAHLQGSAGLPGMHSPSITTANTVSATLLAANPGVAGTVKAP